MFYIVINLVIRSGTCPVIPQIVVGQCGDNGTGIIDPSSAFCMITVIPHLQPVQSDMGITGQGLVPGKEHIGFFFRKTEVFTESLFRSHGVFIEHV